MNYFWQVATKYRFSQSPDLDLCPGQTTQTAQGDQISDLVNL